MTIDDIFAILLLALVGIAWMFAIQIDDSDDDTNNDRHDYGGGV